MDGNAWLFWASASAGSVLLAAIFAKMGLQGIDSDFTTFIHTLVILAALVLFPIYTGKWQDTNGFTGRNWVFLILSGLTTDASWLAYFKTLQLGSISQVAPADKFSLVLVVPVVVVLLNERPSAQEWVGLGPIVVGVLTLALKR